MLIQRREEGAGRKEQGKDNEVYHYKYIYTALQLKNNICNIYNVYMYTRTGRDEPYMYV